MIAPVGFAIALTLTVVLVKLSSFLAPFNLYFSFSTLFVQSSEFFPGRALLLKLGIPFLVGVIIVFSAARTSNLIGTRSPIAKRLANFVDDFSVSTVRSATFFAAVLLTWPMIVHWDILSAFEVRDYRWGFFAMYLLYFASYGALGSAGARVGLKLSGKGSSGKAEWFSAARDSFVGALAGGCASVVLSLVLNE